MSEPLLKALIKLFALVAKEDHVTEQERNQVKLFLEEHVSSGAVSNYFSAFEKVTNEIAGFSAAAVREKIQTVCKEVNQMLTQKQKAVIILELINIIQADGQISATEQELLELIGLELKLDKGDVEAIRTFVLGDQPGEFDDDHLLVVDADSSAILTKAHHLKRTNLHGFLTILHVVQAEQYFVKYIGTTTVFLNSVPLLPGKIVVLAVGSLIRWEKDEPVYYGDILNQFRAVGEMSQLSFEAKNLTYKFPNGRIGLRDVSVAEKSGNLVALMGASGAGKSTLLHVLNGSEKPEQGQVLINGIDLHKNPEKLEGIIGFVPQDDLLMEDLTVYQNLYYAAKLCFSDKSTEEIDTLVLRVLEDLGLSETKDLKVGSPLKKTISGGQRKRLNIGLELLREPAVLFCDEPTSGLSSRDSENIIDLLKELTLKGKLVFAVIHQPSSDIFKMFDRLVILDTGGYQIYYGNPVDAIVHFKHAINLIDHEHGECTECGNVNPEQIFNIIESKVINEYGNFTTERKISPTQWEKAYRAARKIFTVPEVKTPPITSLRIPPRVKQILIFASRDLQAKIHNTQYLVINLLEAPLLAFILAYIVRYYNIDDKLIEGYVFEKNLNIPAYLFMSVIVALFMGLTVSAEEIIRDRKILKRESFLHLSRSSYLFSKILILFTLSAVQTGTFVLVASYFLKIHGLFFEHWMILFTTSCFANVLGLNISSAFNSAVTIYILIPLLLIPQLILSGVVVKFDKLNPAIGNTATVPFVGDLMASRWAFEASMVSTFKDNEFESEYYPYDKIMADADYKKVYYLPTLETKLQYCFSNLTSKDPEVISRKSEDFKVLHHELTQLSEDLGKPLPSLPKIANNQLDSAVYSEVTQYLELLKQHYVTLYNRADRIKEAKLNELTNSPEKEKAFNEFREKYHNDAVAELVKNVSEPNRIIEKDGQLIQKIYPIYKDPDPEHAIDFDAQFYMPAKHFLNRDVDTFIFNNGVIWSMSLVMMIMLYFDVLRRIITGFGNLSNPINRRA